MTNILQQLDQEAIDLQRRRAAILQEQAASEARQQALALSDQQHAEQAEREALQAEMQAGWEKFAGTGPAFFEPVLENNLTELRAIAEATQLLLGLSSWQINAHARATSEILRFCRQALPYENVFASRAEFRLALISTVADLTRGLSFFPGQRLDRYTLTTFMSLFRIRKVTFDVGEIVDYALKIGPLPEAVPVEQLTAATATAALATAAAPVAEPALTGAEHRTSKRKRKGAR